MSAGLLNTVGVARIDDCCGIGRVAALCARSNRMEMKSSANKKMTKVRGSAFEKVESFMTTSFQALLDVCAEGARRRYPDVGGVWVTKAETFRALKTRL